MHPAEYCCGRYWWARPSADACPSVIKTLLKPGADPNHADENGTMPLAVATVYCLEDACDLEVMSDCWEVICLLVKSDARLDDKDEALSPLSIAAEGAEV